LYRIASVEEKNRTFKGKNSFYRANETEGGLSVITLGGCVCHNIKAFPLQTFDFWADYQPEWRFFLKQTTPS
jgi:hypothetical protein